MPANQHIVLVILVHDLLPVLDDTVFHAGVVIGKRVHSRRRLLCKNLIHDMVMSASIDAVREIATAALAGKSPPLRPDLRKTTLGIRALFVGFSVKSPIC